MAERVTQGSGRVHVRVALCLVLLSTAACSKKENPGQEPRYVLRERICPGVFKITSGTSDSIVLNSGRRTVPVAPVTSNIKATLTVSQADAAGLYHATFQMDRVRLSAGGMTVDTNEPEPQATETQEPQMWFAIPEPTNTREQSNANEPERASPEKRVLVRTPDATRTAKKKPPEHELYTLAASFTEAPVRVVFDANMKLMESSSELGEKVTAASADVKELFEAVGFNVDEVYAEMLMRSCGEMLPKDEAGVGALWRYTTTRDTLGGQIEWGWTGELERVVEQDGCKVAHISYRGSARDRHNQTVELAGESVTINRISSDASGTLLFDIGLGFPTHLTFRSNGKVWMTKGGQRIRCDTAQEMTVTFTRLK